jgi:hypothetical protein
MCPLKTGSGPGDRPNKGVDKALTGGVPDKLWKTVFLVKSFEEITDQRVEISVLFPELVHLSNRVNHRRVVLAAEAPADLGQ